MAQSIELPPPTATMKSIWCSRAKRETGIDVLGGRVLLDGVEQEDAGPGGLEGLHRPIGMAGGADAGVGDEQYALAAQFAHQFPDAGQRPGPEDHPRQRLEIESHQGRGGGWCGGGSSHHAILGDLV